MCAQACVCVCVCVLALRLLPMLDPVWFSSMCSLPLSTSPSSPISIDPSMITADNVSLTVVEGDHDEKHGNGGVTPGETVRRTRKMMMRMGRDDSVEGEDGCGLDRAEGVRMEMVDDRLEEDRDVEAESSQLQREVPIVYRSAVAVDIPVIRLLHERSFPLRLTSFRFLASCLV